MPTVPTLSTRLEDLFTCFSLGAKCVFSELTLSSKLIRGNFGTASMFHNTLFLVKRSLLATKQFHHKLAFCGTVNFCLVGW